jgi:hypothetical protein
MAKMTAHTGPFIGQRQLLIIVAVLIVLAGLLSFCERKRMNTRKVYYALLQSSPLTVEAIAEKTDLRNEQVRSALQSLKRNGGHVVSLDKSIKFSGHKSRHGGDKQKWRLNNEKRKPGIISN